MLKKKVKNKNDFIKKAKNFHGNTFDYSKSIFVDENSPITIKCNNGHNFIAIAKNHLNGQGCHICYEKFHLYFNKNNHNYSSLVKEKKEILKSFTCEMISVLKKRKLLEISDNKEFFIEKGSLRLENKKWISEIGKGDTFDFIFGNFKYSDREKLYKRGSLKIKIYSYLTNILSSLKFLENNGIGFFRVNTSHLCQSSYHRKSLSKEENQIRMNQDFESLLNSEGYFINAIFHPPEGLFSESTLIHHGFASPVMVLISREKTESVFLGELLNKEQSINLAKNYLKKLAEDNLENGILIPKRNFKGFSAQKIEIQIDKINKNNFSYKHFKLKELATEINPKYNSLTVLKEKPNSIYFMEQRYRQEGLRPVECKIPNVVKIHQGNPSRSNCYQVVLSKKANNKYISSYFETDIGKLTIQSITIGKPNLRLPDLENISIPLPSLEDQQQIVETLKKLEDLKEKIDNFNSEIAINLSSTKEISGDVDNMLEVLGRLTQSDRIMSLIRQGESDKLEFKETLSLDLKKDSKEKYIEESVLKTIVAFLNKDGGILLIGVNDKGLIKGIEAELKRLWKNMDKFLQHFKNIRRDRIGINYDICIDIKPAKIDKKTILKVECARSNVECYLDEEDFYLRTNPANEKLTGRRLSDYIQERFR